MMGWEDALDDLDDYADRYNNFDWIFACIVPAGNFSLNGISHAANDRPWPLENDRRCFLVPGKAPRDVRPRDGAHARRRPRPVRRPGQDFPEGIDARTTLRPNLPGATEPGVVGWRPSDGELMGSPWSELMSYCTPSNGPA